VLDVPTPTPAVDPQAPGAWVLDLATASAGVLNLRRLGGMVVRHLVPLVAPAVALVVVADGEVTDPSIVDESVAWWATVLTARGVAPADAGRVAGLTADVLDRHDLPVAAAALRAAAAT
jgi:hypothetical protein